MTDKIMFTNQILKYSVPEPLNLKGTFETSSPSCEDTNLLFNTSSLSPHWFEAGLKVGEYMMLVLTNSLGVAVTLGLFFPWAKIRTIQYKLQHLTLLAAGSLEGFIADEKEQVSAIGEEVGDFFDMDFGL